MLSNLRAIVVGVAVVGLCASNAYASDVEEEVRQMQDLVLQMQDQLNEQQKRIDGQSVQLQDAGLQEDRKASSGLSSFLTETDFGGWVAVNYSWNSKGHNKGVALLDKNTARDGGLFGSNTQSHPDSNSFKLDQLWFVMDKDVSAESRAGFHTDISFGAGGFGSEPGETDLTVYTGYVSWLAPLGDGLRFDVGKMWTWLGAEVVAAPDNFNITRGLVWGMQPVSNVGLNMSYTFGPVEAGFGVYNDTDGQGRDADNNKAISGMLGYNSDIISVRGSVLYGKMSGSWDTEADGSISGGSVIPGNSDREGTFDLLISSDPIDMLSLYLDYTMRWTEDSGTDFMMHGIALAGRVAIGESAGAALRFETVVPSSSNISTTADDVSYSMTLTGDYSLTDQLLFRGEARWDWNSPVGYWSGGNDINGQICCGTSSNRLMLTAEAIYTF
jgi:hypothetical protein